MINGTIFLNFHSDFSLLMCGDSRDFCVFILYLATLQNLLIRYSNFVIVSLQFSMYGTMSSADSESGHPCLSF